MKSLLTIAFLLFFAQAGTAQKLHLKKRAATAMPGTVFAASIMDTTLSLQAREEIIYREIKSGNVPGFLRNLKEIKDTLTAHGKTYVIRYWVLPDYLAIGSNEDFFYIPMTPMLAQKVANLVKASLSTKKIVDKIYAHAGLKLQPQPMPPTREMTTVKYFKQHSDSVKMQIGSRLAFHNEGALTAGNKKDVIISNKIYGEKTPRVVIYGWHKADGKPIQPVYNKHTNTWADYSHGIRLVQNKMQVNGKKMTFQKVLADRLLSALLSDEGVINNAKYPVAAPYDN